MKNLKNLSKLILLFLVSTLTMPAFSQGVAIYKKDGTMVKYAYEEIDSIVTYNYGETPEIPETPETPDTPVAPPAETQYEAVNLGLSVKWATHNVGASSPEEYGGYYAWGETEEKDDYSWGTYKWCNGNEATITKYCTNSNIGTVDNKTVLDLEDDVAHVKWGGTWRMPTNAELNELLNNCTWTWTTQNDVNGYKVTGPNGNSIFLPAADYHYGTGLDGSGSFGIYWSGSLYGSSDACYLRFGSGGYDWNNGSRCYGRSVRPVSK